MQYRKNKSGEDISILGYGCMRFSKNRFGGIDLAKAEREIMAAIAGGINYFDTAYVYLGSEAALGEILQKNQCRDKVKIATKLPHYLVKSRESMEKHFQEQLSRLRTDHIDYYLMHMLTDVNTWERLKTMGAAEWIAEKKANGQIGQIGFSYHGNSDMFVKLLDAYDWDFCQIQYNYIDEFSQAGKQGLQYANRKAIPVIIMEPLRGGRLVGLLPTEAKAIFAAESRKRSPAEWALRWLWNQPEVTCVLSGMNSIEMVKENIQVASDVRPGEFTEKEFQMIEQVKTEINSKTKVGCTGCGYCMPCPQGVDIPGTFRCWNAMYTENKKSGRNDYLMSTVLRAKASGASHCIGCGKCEPHCPQKIQIRKELKNAAADLETMTYKAAEKAIHWFRLW